jgi:hypothetical protein
MRKKIPKFSNNKGKLRKISTSCPFTLYRSQTYVPIESAFEELVS